MFTLENDQKTQKLHRQYRQELDLVQQELLSTQQEHMKQLQEKQGEIQLAHQNHKSEAVTL